MGFLKSLRKKKSKKSSKGTTSSNTEKKSYDFYKIGDNYKTYEALQNALREKGLESSQLVIGVDYTKSNNWTGKKSFEGKCLHDTTDGKNPYQKVIKIIGKTLEPFDDDNEIPVYGFGDKTTGDTDVFPFFQGDIPCRGFAEVLARYNQITPNIKLSGPTNFAPLIEKTIQIVENTGEYHILVIIADGQVSKPVETANAIVKASRYPISIIMVGVGDGPWDEMERYDDELPKRKFDNFQFVEFNSIINNKYIENRDVEFARNAMMEIPEQYQAIKKLGLLDKVSLNKKKLPNTNPQLNNNSQMNSNYGIYEDYVPQYTNTYTVPNAPL